MYLTVQTSPLLALPLELQFSLLPLLQYPDVLALKHTCRDFYNLVDSTGSAAGIRRRVAWLVQRHKRGLPCPHRQCELETDERFCSSGKGQVSQLIESRRRHGECRVGDKGCEIVVGRSCGGSNATKMRWMPMMGPNNSWHQVWVGWGMFVVGLLLASVGFNLLELCRCLS